MTTEFAPDYVDVAERLRLLFAKFPDASLRGSYELVTVAEQTFIVYTAECFRSEADNAPGVGTAWEPVPGPDAVHTRVRNAERRNVRVGQGDRRGGAAPSKHVASADEVRARQPYVPDGFDTEEEAHARTRQVTDLAKEAQMGEWVKAQGFAWPWSAGDCDLIAAEALRRRVEAF